MATLLLAAVCGPKGKARIATAADHLLLIVLAGKVDEVPRYGHGRVAAPAATAEAKHQVQRGLLHAVVGQRAVVLQLLPREDEPLLVRWDSCKIN